MLDMIVNNDAKVKNTELDAYGIRHNFVADDLAGGEILRHLNTTKKIYFSPRQVIFNDSTEADTVYIIQKGLVKLLNYLPNGRARIVRLLGPGCILGLSGMFDHIHKHKAVAVHDVVLVKIAAGRIKSIRQQYPDVYVRIMEKMYEDVNIADTWITQFSTGSIKARVARLITFLSYMENESPPDIVELLTCEEMASILGVTPESVSRVLASFKRQKILQPTDGDGETYRRNSQVLLELSQDMRPEHPKQLTGNKTVM